MCVPACLCVAAHRSCVSLCVCVHVCTCMLMWDCPLCVRVCACGFAQVASVFQQEVVNRMIPAFHARAKALYPVAPPSSVLQARSPSVSSSSSSSSASSSDGSSSSASSSDGSNSSSSSGTGSSGSGSGGQRFVAPAVEGLAWDQHAGVHAERRRQSVEHLGGTRRFTSTRPVPLENTFSLW
jgi:hypothetical protein